MKKSWKDLLNNEGHVRKAKKQFRNLKKQGLSEEKALNYYSSNGFYTEGSKSRSQASTNKIQKKLIFLNAYF